MSVFGAFSSTYIKTLTTIIEHLSALRPKPFPSLSQKLSYPSVQLSYISTHLYSTPSNTFQINHFLFDLYIIIFSDLYFYLGPFYAALTILPQDKSMSIKANPKGYQNKSTSQTFKFSCFLVKCLFTEAVTRCEWNSGTFLKMPPNYKVLKTCSLYALCMVMSISSS